MNIFDLPTDDEIVAEAVAEIKHEIARQEREEGNARVRQHHLDLRDQGKCENCATDKNVSLRFSMTAYHWEGPEESDDNPNRQWAGCDICWDEYQSYWQEMWAEYNSGRL